MIPGVLKEIILLALQSLFEPQLKFWVTLLYYKGQTLPSRLRNLSRFNLYFFLCVIPPETNCPGFNYKNVYYNRESDKFVMPVGGRLAGKAGYSAGYQGQGDLLVYYLSSDEK